MQKFQSNLWYDNNSRSKGKEIKRQNVQLISSQFLSKIFQEHFHFDLIWIESRNAPEHHQSTSFSIRAPPLVRGYVKLFNVQATSAKLIMLKNFVVFKGNFRLWLAAIIIRLHVLWRHTCTTYSMALESVYRVNLLPHHHHASTTTVPQY